MQQFSSKTYSNVSVLKVGDFTGSPTDFLSWVIALRNESHPFMDWSVPNNSTSSSDFYYSPEDLKRMISIALGIRYYYIPVIIAIGSVGNILTASTILLTKLSKLPTMHFIVGIAAIDLCFLISLLMWWTSGFSAALTTFPGWCQLVMFTTNLSSFTTVWLHCTLSFERYLSTTADGGCVKSCCLCCEDNGKCYVPPVKPPCKISCKCTTLKVKACILSIFITGVVVYVNISLTVDYIYVGTTPVCVPMRQLFPLLEALNKLDVFFNAIIPLLIILILNLETGRLFVRNHHSRETLISRNCIERANQLLKKKSEVNLTVASFVFCVAFLCFNSPGQILRVIYLFRNTVTVQPHISLREYLIQQLLQAAYYTNFAVNFPIMIVCHGGFRTALKLLLRRVQAKVKRVFHRGGESIQTTQLKFTVEFSSTLMRLHETSLIWKM